MKVATKIVLVACVALLPALGIHTWLSVEREEALFRADMERDLALLGTHLGKMAANEWHRGGDQAVAALLAAASRADAHVVVAWHAQGSGKIPSKRGLASDAGERALVWLEPVRSDAGVLGVISLRESLAPMDRYLFGTLVRFAILGALLVSAALLTARMLSHRLIGRRLDALMSYAAAAGRGDLGRPVPVGGRDEIARLAASLESMSGQLAEARRKAESTNAERLSMLQQLRHADRLATMGRLAGSVAHELGTPLNVVMGHANRIAEGSQAPDQTKESAATIHRQVKRMEGTIRDILGFVRKTPGEEEDIDLVTVTKTVRSLLRPLAKRRQIEIEMASGSDPLYIRGSEGRLEQAVSNLVTNALDASSDGGRVTLTLTREARTSRTGGEAQPVVVLRVRDEGAGVPDEVRERLFEPFFTSKPPGYGTGLGLWLADGIVNEHGGSIEVETTLERGACFAIVLPAVARG